MIEDTLRCTPEPSYIYAIKCSKTGYIKIGMSNNPKGRRNSLQIGSPNRLNLLQTWGPWKESDARYVESILHNNLSVCKVRGEWFDVEIEKIEEICT
jgi:hypothetical protein